MDGGEREKAQEREREREMRERERDERFRTSSERWRLAVCADGARWRSAVDKYESHAASSKARYTSK